ncbi:putative cyclin-A3-1 [Vicia villosa]|uniref:putative cyclin-A3-1 n=1 Tax=Vicia villosa TaxID=3911 RepID=UPI00273C1D17|nr:putative cyclin-A3-1 [Vicia villosa]
MADQDNSTRRPQREAKKRAVAALCEQRKRKRVALGDITNDVVSETERLVSDTHSHSHRQKKKRNTGNSPVPEKPEDPQLCEPYVSDIHDYLRNLEVDPSKRPLPDYIQKVQRDINANMRGVLVDWLVEVAEEYKLVSDTLYFSVSYIDRFLSLNDLSRQKLQLLGVSSMLIASKYEEIKPPEVEDFCYITDNTYSKEEVLSMEAEILKSLKFELGGPTIKTFLRRFITKVGQEGVDASELQFEFLCSYLAELSLLDYNCVKFLPSMVAASVLFLARFMLNPKTRPWNSAIYQCTSYKPADLKECVLNIHDLYLGRKGATLQAVRDKYKQHKFKCVATTPSPPEISLSFFEFRGADT